MQPTPVLLTPEIIIKLYENYEPSKVKIWEMVRSFDPVDFSKLLYMLENVARNCRRELLTGTGGNNRYIIKQNVRDDDHTIILDFEPIIRLTPSIYYRNNVDEKNYFADTSAWAKHNETSMSAAAGSACDITKIMNDIRSGKRVNCETNDAVIEMIVHHNLSTTAYGRLLTDIKSLLLNENYHVDRNNVGVANKMSSNNNGTPFLGRIRETSIVLQFLQFYKSMSYNNASCVDNDPRGFRFLIVPPPTIIYNATDYYKMTHEDSANVIIQPYYMGLRVNVYLSPTEAKIFNAHGELISSLSTLCLRSNNYCTFEAIVLPVDKNNVVRSYRYWPYRSNIVVYIVDVYRVNQQMLINLPFVERISFAAPIVASSYLNNSSPHATQLRLECIPSHLQCAKRLEAQFIQNCDVFDPIVGIVVRNKMHVLIAPKNNATAAYAYKFNIRHGFDLLEMKPIDLYKLQVHDNVQTLRNYRYYFNLDMADYKIVCLVYGHCDRFFYICEYNRQVQQFVHAAKLERHFVDRCVKINKSCAKTTDDSYSDDITIRYKPDRIYVLNNKTQPRGVLYLRVYYNIHRHAIGYEIKLTDGRFKLPFKNHLLQQE